MHEEQYFPFMKISERFIDVITSSIIQCLLQYFVIAIDTGLPADIFEKIVIHLRQSFHLLAKFHYALRYGEKKEEKKLIKG